MKKEGNIMEKFVVEDNSGACENQPLLEELINQIKLFENILLEKMECTPNSCFQWILRLEEDKSCPFLQEYGKIKVGVTFLKNVYVLVSFLTKYFTDHFANRNVACHVKIFNELCRNKNIFADACKNSALWNELEKKDKNASKQERNVISNNKIIFCYVMHYFINHEIGHTVHPGNGPTVEKRCDNEATIAMFKLLKKNIKKLHTDADCPLKIAQIMIGGFVAQTFIAHYVKSSSFENFDDEPQINEIKYPKTFERIYNFIQQFNKMWKYGLIKKLQNVVDDSFVYMLMAIIFLYKKINYEEILEYQYSYRDLCTELFKLLCIVPQDKMIKIFSKRRFCKDEYIGLMEYKHGNWLFSRRDDYDRIFVPAEEYNQACSGNVGQPIIFVLESPHKREFLKHGISIFNSSEFCYARPAKGYTKTMFDRYVDTVFNTLGVPQSPLCHPVIIVNACRFQCSLGEKIVRKNSERDKMFEMLFESDIACLNKTSLQERLKKLNPYAIVSASTKGGNPNYIIRDKVDNTINACGLLYYKAYHPAGWRDPNHRKPRP